MKLIRILVVGFSLRVVLLSGVWAQEPVADWEKLAHRYIEMTRVVEPDDIVLTKDLSYDKYTLEDEYAYNKTTRRFQWDTIKVRLALFEALVADKDASWSILQNYRNANGVGDVVKEYGTDVYKRLVDKFGVERFQAIPLYEVADTITPYRYARDGALARIEQRPVDGSKFTKISIADMDGDWWVPTKYMKDIDSAVNFKIAIFVDRINQNIVTIERAEKAKWIIRSMNPATTGLHNPPFQQETPTGLYVLQDRKPKMFYVVDGTSRIAGYAPWANRFTRGAYIHGVPINDPNGSIIEYSWSLGTTPRSHMCVRNASSHAKFIYDWAGIEETLIFVIE